MLLRHKINFYIKKIRLISLKIIIVSIYYIFIFKIAINKFYRIFIFIIITVLFSSRYNGVL